jgi:hypothetical protein
MSEEQLPFRPSLPDIFNGLTASHAFAELYGEQHPEHAEAIQKFLQQLGQAKQDLVGALYRKQED